jgi:hypothetical protein
MTDDEVIDAYHAARRRYESVKAQGHANRVDAFVQLASAQLAFIGRFQTSDYMRYYCERFEMDALELAAILRAHPHSSPFARRREPRGN